MTTTNMCSNFGSKWSSVTLERFLSISRENATKHQKSMFGCMWLILRSKNVFVNICPISLV